MTRLQKILIGVLGSFVVCVFCVIGVLLIARSVSNAPTTRAAPNAKEQSVQATARAIVTENARAVRIMTANAQTIPSVTDSATRVPTLDVYATMTVLAQMVTQTAEARLNAAPPLPMTATFIPITIAPSEPSATPTIFYVVVTGVPTAMPVVTQKPPTSMPQQVPPPQIVPTFTPAPANGCDPNYTPCVPANATDVDCEGGVGDGPVYVKGPIRIIGVDHYRLDTNGDGIACDK